MPRVTLSMIWHRRLDNQPAYRWLHSVLRFSVAKARVIVLPERFSEYPLRARRAVGGIEPDLTELRRASVVSRLEEDRVANIPGSAHSTPVRL